MNKKIEIYLKHIPLIISIIALAFTILLTIKNINYFENQRYDLLNQQLYEKKIIACSEIISCLHDYLNHMPFPDKFRVNNQDSLLNVNSKFLDEFDKLINKWEVILPNKVILDLYKAENVILDIVPNYQKIVISNLQAERKKNTIQEKETLIKQNRQLAESLFSSYLVLINDMRAYLGVEKLSNETLKIIKKIKP